MLADLEADVRRMLLPNTAINLKESKRNRMKDFVAVAGPLGVTHFVMLSASHNGSYLRVAKTPRVSPRGRPQHQGARACSSSVPGTTGPPPVRCIQCLL